jgi:hypothetical protein
VHRTEAENVRAFVRSRDVRPVGGGTAVAPNLPCFPVDPVGALGAEVAAHWCAAKNAWNASAESDGEKCHPWASFTPAAFRISTCRADSTPSAIT